MRYISTRGGAPAVDFTEALLAGLAPDGGLYTPERWPTLASDAIAGFAGRPYAQVAAEVVGAMAGEAFASADLLAMCEAAYASFHHPAVTPLRQMGDDLWLLELFHGPTLAFKDVAMQLLARLYDAALARSGKRLTLVVATSGDTGGAAVEAFAGAKSVRMVVLFPNGKISDVQRRFMTTADAANVQCVAVDGTFDDCQALVKGLFSDRRLSEEVGLSGVNSINFGRIAAQAVYYFTAAAALGSPQRGPVSFVVPTGNFGDAFAGYAAHRMGLSIERITVATNSNAILAHAFSTGRYARGPVLETQSPAMDIQVASNFERLWFEAVDRDGPATASAFADFASAGAVSLPQNAFADVGRLFSGSWASEEETTAAMAAAWKDAATMIDPHTAVALSVCAREGRRGPAPTVVLSTAHPAKFPEPVRAATGADPGHALAASLAGKPERFDRLANDAEALKAYVRAFAA